MKKVFKYAVRTLITIIAILILSIAGLTINHHVRLAIEKNELHPIGKLVEVNGHEMHVYSEGPKSEKPTLVFMSGSGVPNPAYDFKTLYTRLSDEYRISVVEKAGYGYSENTNISRDIETMLAETREALKQAGETGPYILFPHSVSGTEALYWAQRYPEEVKAIVGLDMSVPDVYVDMKIGSLTVAAGRFSGWIGLHRIPFVGDRFLNEIGLSEDELKQSKMLLYRNQFDKSFILEVGQIVNNAKKVKESGYPSVPMLMFTSDGAETTPNWLELEQAFAKATGNELIELNGGHYVHKYEPKLIAEKSKAFFSSLN
ncbi:alpha/beta hydrolase [Sporosarcina sp. BI001-red]|uniref:alpha/beta hydrolase n=1 Tax=Sporosarcina sp. BI001-red TaxID=2282866 RepID=UPI000E21C9B0|nr:alpha/beta hydrolase [Sporosarcina sp. BI001-red]REB05199.1 alpha/beta hydrolase [Sporosarcina sp. BI001-red]